MNTHIRRYLQIATMFGIVACSGGSAGDIVLGAAETGGEIDGAPIRLRSALFGFTEGYFFVFTGVASRHQEIAMTNFDDKCGNGRVFGRILYLDLFEDPTSGIGAVTRPGQFEVWGPPVGAPGQASEIPTKPIVVATFAEESEAGGRVMIAASGMVTVSKVSSDELAGTFDLVFENQLTEADNNQLTGTFRARHCDKWARNAGVP